MKSFITKCVQHPGTSAEKSQVSSTEETSPADWTSGQTRTPPPLQSPSGSTLVLWRLSYCLFPGDLLVFYKFCSRMCYVSAWCFFSCRVSRLDELDHTWHLCARFISLLFLFQLASTCIFCSIVSTLRVFLLRGCDCWQIFPHSAAILLIIKCTESAVPIDINKWQTFMNWNQVINR